MIPKKTLVKKREETINKTKSFSIDYWNPLLIDVANSSSTLYFELEVFFFLHLKFQFAEKNFNWFLCLFHWLRTSRKMPKMSESLLKCTWKKLCTNLVFVITSRIDSDVTDFGKLWICNVSNCLIIDSWLDYGDYFKTPKVLENMLKCWCS